MRTHAPHYRLAAALVGAGLTIGGCATEEYVDQQIAATNATVEGRAENRRVVLVVLG